MGLKRAIHRTIDQSLGRPNDQVVVFLHLPKCGGTSLRDMLMRNYRPWRVMTYDGIPENPAFTRPWSLDTDGSANARRLSEELSRRHRHLDALTGHLPYGVHRHFDRRCAYFTFVREPVAAVWSMLNYVADNQDNWAHEALRRHNFDLAALLGRDETYFLSNCQSRLLLGTDRVQLNSQDVPAVLKRIDDDIAFAAPIELIDAALPALQDRFGWKREPLPRLNQGTYARGSSAPSPELVEAIRAHNAVDLALYEHVLSRWESRVSHELPTQEAPA